MEDLKAMLDKGMSIAEIKETINQFVDSARDYADTDKLKLTFVLLNLIQEGTSVLRTISVNDFTKQINERIDEVEKEYKTLSDEYNVHFKQDNEIVSILIDKEDKKLASLQNDINNLLSKYDSIIKEIVKIREALPIEKQIEKEF